jgi:hypothetical protein
MAFPFLHGSLASLLRLPCPSSGHNLGFRPEERLPVDAAIRRRLLAGGEYHLGNLPVKCIFPCTADFVDESMSILTKFLAVITNMQIDVI